MPLAEFDHLSTNYNEKIDMQGQSRGQLNMGALTLTVNFEQGRFKQNDVDTRGLGLATHPFHILEVLRVYFRHIYYITVVDT